MNEIRVRYAPSPTGYLHIGNARTALFNYLYARSLGGDFIIRIENTDIQRNIEGGSESQLENLKWLGIDWDESIDIGGKFAPYNQLERYKNGTYTKYIEKLLEDDSAYKCFCTSEELEAQAELQKKDGRIPKYNGTCAHLTPEQIKEKEEKQIPYSIRFRVPKNETIKWNDIVKKNVSFNSKDVAGDFNILKRDGIPTYNFAVVVDDYEMKISHVFRGEDHLSNTPKQIMLYNALGYEIPKFGHMTLITNEVGKKLSKRDGGIIQFIEQYKDLGYLSEAMFNFISLLGWSPIGEKEIFSKEELIKIFTSDRLSKSPAKFDVDKLMFINNQYMKKLENEKYIELVYPFIKKEYGIELDGNLEEILKLYKNQLSYGAEIIEKSLLFFQEFKLDEDIKDYITNLDEEHKNSILEAYSKKIEMIADFNDIDVQFIKSMIKEIQKETGYKGKELFMPIRIFTTGEFHGPELADTILLLGKDKILNNLKYIKKIV